MICDWRFAIDERPARAGVLSCSTGLWPVVSGVAPETRGIQSARGFPNVCAALARTKSGATPDFTGATPVLHDAKTGGLSAFSSFPPFSSVRKNIL